MIVRFPVRDAAGNVGARDLDITTSAGYAPPSIARMDLANGLAPFTTSTPATVFVADDPTPTQAFGGRVVVCRYPRTDPASSADVNRRFRYTLDTLSGIGYGQTIFVRGKACIPTPVEPQMRNAQRKLFYFNILPEDGMGYLFLKAEGLTSNGLGQPMKFNLYRIGGSQNIGCTQPIMFDTVTSLEVQITVNTEASPATGTPDGIVRLWKDGVLIAEKTDCLLLKAGSSATYRKFHMGDQTQHLFADKSVTYTEDRYWSDVDLSHYRMGPH